MKLKLLKFFLPTITFYSLLFLPAVHTAYSQTLPPSINQATSINIAPTVSFDGQVMVFLSNRSGQYLFYECTRKNDSEWNDPVAIDIINRWAEGFKITSPHLNYNGNRLYFSSNCKSFGGLDIYVCERDGKTWKEPVNAGQFVNTAADEDWPSVSLNEQTMYLTRGQIVGKEKEPCSAIYKSEKNAEGIWQSPAILASPLNDMCSKAPRLCADNKTLYFSSNRNDPKNGTFTLFYTSEILPGAWLIPLPLNIPNLEETNVLSISVDPNRKVAYVEQSTLQARRPAGNIAVIPLPQQFQPECSATVYGKVTDMFSGKPLPAKIEVSDLNTFEVYNHVENIPQTGEYKLLLPRNKEYKLDVYNDSASHFYFTCDTRTFTKDTVLKQDVRLSTYISLTLNVYDRDVFEPLDVKLTVTEAGTGNILQQVKQGVAQGRYQVRLPIGKDYMILFEKENYDRYQFPFDMKKVVQFNEYERDIMMVSETEEIEINISDLYTGENPGDVQIVINNLTNNEQIVVTSASQPSEAGKYKARLRKGDSYEVQVNGPKGYAYYYTKVNVDDESFTGNIEAKLAPLVAQTHITLNNITFETNSADLNVTSYQELDRLLQLMRDNPQISVEISAHTDDVGADAYNNRLSEKRASTVVSYMLDHNIPSTRIVAKGYGRTKPIVPNTSEMNRAQNRRVEFKIIDVKNE